MSLRLNLATIDKNRSIKLGTVKEVRPGTGSAEGKVTTVVLEGTIWNAEEKKEELQTIEIAFWNGEVAKMADRISSAKVTVGSILTVEVYEKEGKYIGNNFKYQGHWVIPKPAEKEEGSDMHIFMGTVASVQTGESTTGKKWTRISMPDEKRSGEETTWLNITFWNNEKSNLADNAMKLLSEREGKKTKAVVLTYENGEYNEKKQYRGFEFVVLK